MMSYVIPMGYGLPFRQHADIASDRYALAQLSGANSVTSYFVPILTIIGLAGGVPTRDLFLTGMYAVSKLCFTMIASFFFIDALGRRRSLFIGASIQMISHLCIGVYIKFEQQGAASTASAKGALAALFIHAFGYSVGESVPLHNNSSTRSQSMSKAYSFCPTYLVVNCGPIGSGLSAPRSLNAFTGFLYTASVRDCRHFFRAPTTGEPSFSSPLGAFSRLLTFTLWYRRCRD